MPALDSAVLVLADGTVFRGRSIGARGSAAGEVVFNTAMTGYQEILTDPSYCRQIVTLTCPHIGNTGTNDEDLEAARLFASGLVIRDLPRRHSSWRATGSLSEFLVRHGIVGIAETTCRHWLTADLDLPPEQLAQAVSDLAWAGLRGLRPA